MIEALRPSTLGEILDRTAHLYRARFLVFFGIAAIPAGVVLACAAGVFLSFAWMGSGGAKAGDEVVGVVAILFFAACGLVLLPLCVAATGLGAGALNHAAAAMFLNEKTTIRGAYAAAWKRGWQYLWLYVLQSLILAVAPLLIGFVSVFIVARFQVWSQKSGIDASAVIAALVLVILAALAAYAVWMLLMLCLAFPSCVVENAGAWTAVKRAISLSKGTRGRLFVLYLLGAVLGWILSMLITVPVIVAASLIPGLKTPQHSQTLGMFFLFTIYGASFAVQALTKPVYAIALLLFYYDQRIPKEGFDIEWMMRQAGMVQAPAPAPEAAPWMPALPGKHPVPELSEPLLSVSPSLSSLEPGMQASAAQLAPDTEALPQVSRDLA